MYFLAALAYAAFVLQILLKLYSRLNLLYVRWWIHWQIYKHLTVADPGGKEASPPVFFACQFENSYGLVFSRTLDRLEAAPAKNSCPEPPSKNS